MDRIEESPDEVFSRSYRTKKNIALALNRLCESQAFSQVRIEDIACEAQISRSSFYHHFEDKNAVIRWISLQCSANGIDQIGRTLTWFKGHL